MEPPSCAERNVVFDGNNISIYYSKVKSEQCNDLFDEAMEYMDWYIISFDKYCYTINTFQYEEDSASAQCTATTIPKRTD